MVALPSRVGAIIRSYLLTRKVNGHLPSLCSPPAAPALLPDISAGVADNSGEVAGEVIAQRHVADACGEQLGGEAGKGLLNLEKGLAIVSVSEGMRKQRENGLK